jgi:hypothetical protein
MSDTDTTPAATPKPRVVRDYLVLTLDDETNLWMVVKAVRAATVAEAIEAAAAPLGEGTYAAVPERFWSVRKLELETIPKVKLSPA